MERPIGRQGRGLRLAVVGDTHFVAPEAADAAAGPRRASASALAFYRAVTDTVWPRIAAEIRAAAPDLAIQAGDLVEGGFQDVPGAAADLVRGLGHLAALGCPVAVAQGNHDRSPASTAVPAWRDTVLPWVGEQLRRAGQPGRPGEPEHEYYCFERDGCQIVVLDPTLVPGDVQHAWLRDVLARGGARRRFVVGHYPVVPLGRPGFAPFATATMLGPMLAAARVDAYFCAHTHNQSVSVHHFPDGPVLQVTGTPVGVGAGASHRFGRGQLPLEAARPLCPGPAPCDYLWGFLEDTTPGWYLVEAADDEVTLTWRPAAGGETGEGSVRWREPGRIEEIRRPPATVLPSLPPGELADVRAARVRLAGYGALRRGKTVWLNGTAIGEIPVLQTFSTSPAIELAAEHLPLVRGENELAFATASDEAALIGAALLEADLADGRCVRTAPSEQLWAVESAAVPLPGDLARWTAPSPGSPGGWLGESLGRVSPGETVRGITLRW